MRYVSVTEWRDTDAKAEGAWLRAAQLATGTQESGDNMNQNRGYEDEFKSIVCHSMVFVHIEFRREICKG